MKTIKTSVLVLCTFLISFTFYSCGKEQSATPGTSTVAEDKAFINDISTNTNNCIKAARDGNLSQSIIKFLNLSNGTVGNENWVDSMSVALENVMGVLDVDPNDSKFNFSAYWGTYNWNRTTKTFSKTAAIGIFINIPSDPAQTTNNVAFKFTEYTDGLYQANAKNLYLPKTAKASITKNNVLIADLNFLGNSTATCLNCHAALGARHYANIMLGQRPLAPGSAADTITGTGIAPGGYTYNSANTPTSSCLAIAGCHTNPAAARAWH